MLQSLLPEEINFFLLQGELIHGIVQQRIIIFLEKLFFISLAEMTVDSFLLLSHLAELPDSIERMIACNNK